MNDKSVLEADRIPLPNFLTSYHGELLEYILTHLLECYVGLLTGVMVWVTYWCDGVGYLLVRWCGLLTGVIVWVTGVIERVTYWGDG